MSTLTLSLSLTLEKDRPHPYPVPSFTDTPAAGSPTQVFKKLVESCLLWLKSFLSCVLHINGIRKRTRGIGEISNPVYSKRQRQFVECDQGRFAKVRTGRPDQGRTGHFENEIGLFQEFLMKNDFLRAYYLAFD